MAARPIVGTSCAPLRAPVFCTTMTIGIVCRLKAGQTPVLQPLLSTATYTVSHAPGPAGNVLITLTGPIPGVPHS